MKAIGRVTGMLAVALALSCAAPAMAQNFSKKIPCGDTIPKKLAEYGLDMSKIADTLTEEQWSSSRLADAFQGWLVYLRPKSCSSGHLVFSVTPSCVIETVYTSSECQVKGVPHY